MALVLTMAVSLQIASYAQSAPTSKDGPGATHTAVGARNPDLHDGAVQLRFGNPEAGIRLTRRGLEAASTTKEQYSAYSNLCAGYILIEQYENAVQYCDYALNIKPNSHQALSNRALARFYLKAFDLAQADVDAGLALAPQSRSLNRVARLIRDEVDPVIPEVQVEHETP